jgi:hypothetical protein
MLEAHWEQELQKVVPTKDLNFLSSVFPQLREIFPTFKSFSKAGIDDLKGTGMALDQSRNVQITDSILLLNRGDHFLLKVLPIEAQFSPVFGIGVADFNGDGKTDAILAMNFFGVIPGESRQDAGCGLLLLGDGEGGFKPATPLESGIAFFGEGRGLAVCDFDHDGRMDFAATQYRGGTKLFHNVTARRGLRVRLKGTSANPQAIGASVRLHFKSGRDSPAQEIKLGAGYLSQDSPGLVFGLPADPESLRIQWPGGKEQTVPVAQGAELVEAKAE